MRSSYLPPSVGLSTFCPLVPSGLMRSSIAFTPDSSSCGFTSSSLSSPLIFAQPWTGGCCYHHELLFLTDARSGPTTKHQSLSNIINLRCQGYYLTVAKLSLTLLNFYLFVLSEYSNICVFSRSVMSNYGAWTVAGQAPLSMGFPRKEYWRGLWLPTGRIFPTQGSNPCLLHLLHWQVDYFFFTAVQPGQFLKARKLWLPKSCLIIFLPSQRHEDFA